MGEDSTDKNGFDEKRLEKNQDITEKLQRQSENLWLGGGARPFTNTMSAPSLPTCSTLRFDGQNLSYID